MEESLKTIKKTYDKYEIQDFSYGTPDSDNLNPKREITFDNLDRIVAKLQEVTDDIIRKKIVPPEEPEIPIEGPLGGESVVQGIPLIKQQLIAQAGGVGNALIFPIINPGMDLGPLDKILEQVIGSFPISKLLSELDKPPVLECELILQQYEFEDSEVYDEAEEEAAGKSPKVPEKKNDLQKNPPDPPPGGKEKEDEPDEKEEEEDDSAEECAEIELTWLKILLILVKVIKILKIIIDIVLSLIVPILYILQLAIGAWLNPPNIAIIIQYIIEMVTALIVMIIALVIQMIWNLLNLDCICDQVMSIIDQIRRALSMFSSLMNAFNPNAVNLLGDMIKDKVMDPLSDIVAQAENKKEDWGKFTQDMKSQFGSKKGQADLLGQMKKNIAAGVKTGTQNLPQIGQAQALYANAKGLFEDSITETLQAMKALKDTKKALAAMGGKIGAGLSGTAKRAAALFSKPAIENMSQTNKET